jgi:hypothetical protein
MTIVALEQTRSTNEERTMFYGDYDYQLGKDRTEQARAEIERNRLEARLAKGTRLEGETRRSAVSRGTALVASLLR